MEQYLRTLLVDVSNGFYKLRRYSIGDFFGPVDLGLFLAGRFNSLNIGAGLLAGSIFPGSNRLVFTGFSPCWGGFYISSMGGAGLVFDNLGINMLAVVGRAERPSVLCLNRNHGEEISVAVEPMDLERIWEDGRQGVYALMDHVLDHHGDGYETTPRVLAVGPAALATDFGAICSAPVVNDRISEVDTWAGRGGLGSKMLQEHGIAAVIYGGTFIDQDFRDRRVADSWFESRYNKKMSAKDLESTTKYRFDPAFKTGGTFGVNYATLGGRTLSFNYRSIYLSEDARLDIHQKLIGDHYLRQFNQETIEPKRHKTCGEPCGAVCKKMYGKYKKDYEPYQVMGPLSGIFDQRAAERVVHLADTLGFDAISAGGVIAWLMECVSEGFLHPEEVGAVKPPLFSPDGFDPVADSAHNAGFAVSVLESIVRRRGILDLSQGARVFARRLARERGQEIIDSFVFNSFARRGWMVPNQYWSPGVLSPMPIMGKYYMHYGNEFMTPRDLGRKNAERMYKELIMDNCGMCRFHRSWAEEMLPEIVGSLYGFREQFLSNAWVTACRINSRNSSGFWESERNIDMIHAFLKRKHQVEGIKEHELLLWLRRFDEDKHEAALGFWYDIHKGVQETLSEYRPPPDHTAQRPSN